MFQGSPQGPASAPVISKTCRDVHREAGNFSCCHGVNSCVSEIPVMLSIPASPVSDEIFGKGRFKKK